MKVIEAINLGLHRAFEKDPSVLLIGEDLLDPYGGAFKAGKGLSSRYPDRVLTTPVSEAGIVGLSAGLALRGFRPVTEIMFGDFLLLAADQIINHVAKYRWMYHEQVSVPLVIRAPMGGRRGYGPTHSQSLEKHLLGTPHLRVVALSPVHRPDILLEQIILNAKDPTIVIENKTTYAHSLLEDSPGHWNIRQIGDDCPTTLLSLGDFEEADVTLITYGGMTPIAMQAAEELMMEEEVTVEIASLSSLQPLPIRDLEDSIKRSRVVLIAEEASEAYGVGSEISHQVTGLFFDLLKLAPQRVGALEFPIGNSPVLEDVILPGRERLVTKIKETLERAKVSSERQNGL